jgi:hypothetical protein
MNATGQGEALVDLVAKCWAGEPPVAVYLMHGDQRIQESYRKIRLGKAWLVTRLQTLLQTGCLHLPRIPEGEQLAEDLLNYQIKVDESANDRNGAFQVGRHDDLVTALGLAVQTDPPPPAVAVRPRYF